MHVVYLTDSVNKITDSAQRNLGMRRQMKYICVDANLEMFMQKTFCRWAYM